MWGISGPGRGRREGRPESCLPHMPGPGLGAGGGGACCGGGRFSGAWRGAERGWGELRTPGGKRGRGTWDGGESPDAPERLRG